MIALTFTPNHTWSNPIHPQIDVGATWDPPGSCRPQMGLVLAPWTLLSGSSIRTCIAISRSCPAGGVPANVVRCFSAQIRTSSVLTRIVMFARWNTNRVQGPYSLTVLTWDLTQNLAWTRTESHLRLGPGPSRVVFTKEFSRDSLESRSKSRLGTVSWRSRRPSPVVRPVGHEGHCPRRAKCPTTGRPFFYRRL